MSSRVAGAQSKTPGPEQSRAPSRFAERLKSATAIAAGLVVSTAFSLWILPAPELEEEEPRIALASSTHPRVAPRRRVPKLADPAPAPLLDPISPVSEDPAPPPRPGGVGQLQLPGGETPFLVIIDGIKMGHTPTLRNLWLPAGPHVVDLVKPSGTTDRRQVTVEGGKVLVIQPPS